MKIGTIADLIEYRLRTEESVEIVGETEVETEFGAFRLVCFEDHVNRAVHLALVRGQLDAKTPTLVRVHRQDTLSDVLGLHAPSLHRPLRDALKLIAGARSRRRRDLAARGICARSDARRATRSTRPPEPEVGARQHRNMDFRTFGIGAQIVRALGVRRMRVVGAPKHMHALSGFGLEVVEYVSDAAEREDSHG